MVEISKTFNDMIRPYIELEEAAMTLHKLTGFTLQELISLFARGYTLTPPINSSPYWSDLYQTISLTEEKQK